MVVQRDQQQRVRYNQDQLKYVKRAKTWENKYFCIFSVFEGYHSGFPPSPLGMAGNFDEYVSHIFEV